MEQMSIFDVAAPNARVPFEPNRTYRTAFGTLAVCIAATDAEVTFRMARTEIVVHRPIAPCEGDSRYDETWYMGEDSVCSRDVA